MKPNHTSRRHGRPAGRAGASRVGPVDAPATRLTDLVGGFLLLLAWTVGLLVVGPTLAVLVVGQ